MRRALFPSKWQTCFLPHSSSSCFRRTAAFAAVRIMTSSFCTENDFIRPKLVPRLDRREPYLLWLWMVMDTYTAAQTFISFVRAATGFGVPQKIYLECTEVWTTPLTHLSEWRIICCLGKRIWHWVQLSNEESWGQKHCLPFSDLTLGKTKLIFALV